MLIATTRALLLRQRWACQDFGTRSLEKRETEIEVFRAVACGVWHAVFRLTESSQIALGSTRIARSLGEQVVGKAKAVAVRRLTCH